MKVMKSEWRDRIKHWRRTLQDDFYQPLGEIKWEQFRTMDELSAEEAQQHEFAPCEPGYTWGVKWEYCWFRGKITLPAEAKGQQIVMNLKPGGESTLFVNGKSFGTYRADWVKYPHHFYEDNFLTMNAQGGEEYDILMETYAGQYYPDCGGCATGPVLPGAYEDPAVEGERRTLGVCTYGIFNEDCYQLFMDVDTLCQLLETLDPASLRAAHVADALEKFTLTVDFEQPREKRIESYKAGREVLRPAMEAQNGSTMPTYYAVGNAHIDLAWLWPMHETYRKTARTFAAQLRLLEQYPDYKFIQSQPALYEMCRKYYPELFERIVAAAKKGQWIAEGAMWVEPDTNMASGEALVRQVLYGKKYYKDVFDVDSRVLWLPDTFGYTGALPQILKKCGVKYLVTQKIFWSYNEGEQFPYHYFNWEGIDGTQIEAFLPTSYTYRTDPTEMQQIWNNRTQTRDLDAFMVPFGYGDGGGGPTRDYIEYAEREKNLEGMPRVKMAGPVEFFEDMDAAGGPKNTYVGELYFTAHRGTYTSQAKIKRNNRKAELALRDMELWGSMASLKGMAYDQKKAEELWKELLLHQFHDILPGSGIGRIYEEADSRVTKVIETADSLAAGYASGMATADNSAVTVLNSLSFDRDVLVTLPAAFADGAADQDGNPVPVSGTEEGVKALVHVPSVGGVTLVPAKSEPAKLVTAVEENGTFVLENSLVRAVVNENGEVVSFVLKESGREFAASPMNRFHLYKDVPRLFDAWDIDSMYREQEVEAATDIHVEKVSDGIEAVLRVTGKISDSTYTQTIRLAADSRRIEFVTEVDWKELHRLLKTAFPVQVFANSGINEMQFGYVERPNKRSREYDKERFEVCNHRYSALAESTHGAAVLNDCKYGISINENALELTLLRAAASPEMRADNKIHHFTYAFTAWEGTFAESDVVRQGLDLNVPARVIGGAAGNFSMVQVDRPEIIIDTIKPAEDGSGDLILRMYESKKGSVKAAVTGLSGKAYSCDMMENIEEEVPMENSRLELSFRPFEIRTIRISR